MTETRWAKMSEAELASEVSMYHAQILDAIGEGRDTAPLFIPFIEKIMGKYPHTEINDDYLLKRDITFNDRWTR